MSKIAPDRVSFYQFMSAVFPGYFFLALFLIIANEKEAIDKTFTLDEVDPTVVFSLYFLIFGVVIGYALQALAKIPVRWWNIKQIEARGLNEAITNRLDERIKPDTRNEIVEMLAIQNFSVGCTIALVFHFFLRIYWELFYLENFWMIFLAFFLLLIARRYGLAIAGKYADLHSLYAEQI